MIFRPYFFAQIQKEFQNLSTSMILLPFLSKKVTESCRNFEINHKKQDLALIFLCGGIERKSQFLDDQVHIMMND